MTSFIRFIAIVVATTTLACNVAADAIDECVQETCPLDGPRIDIAGGSIAGIPSESIRSGDRIWLLSTRHLSSSARCINLSDPEFLVYRLGVCGQRETTSLEELASQLTPMRPLVIYVHGNMIDRCNAVTRSMLVHRSIRRYRTDEPVDWLVWSWPSSFDGIRWLKDFREKALRTDAQGLYLASFMRRRVPASLPVTMIGYSFGARIITGSLHALAGGSLGGRRLEGAPTIGAPINAGIVAPALESGWLARNGYHGKATKNLQELVILYSRRDFVLKRYWLINRIRGSMALGYTGPRSFAPRADGSKLPVRSRDCSHTIGNHHREVEYYEEQHHNAGAEMAKLINARFSTQGI